MILPRSETNRFRPLRPAAWVDANSAPMTFPTPLPDYKPGELEKIEAAEAKRNKKKAK